QTAGEETSPLQASLAPNAVRWLMSMRTDGRWATTQENVWSLIALTDWMAATGELEGDYSFDVTLNDQPLGSGRVDADNVGQPVDLRVAVADLLQDYANGLTISRFSDGSQSGEGQLYYTAFLETFLPTAELQTMDPRRGGGAAIPPGGSADRQGVRAAYQSGTGGRHHPGQADHRRADQPALPGGRRARCQPALRPSIPAC
ncbi:MAG: hypothetical protein V9H69_20970, partial [Anaerolineae bacterium]